MFCAVEHNREQNLVKNVMSSRDTHFITAQGINLHWDLLIREIILNWKHLAWFTGTRNLYVLMFCQKHPLAKISTHEKHNLSFQRKNKYTNFFLSLSFLLSTKCYMRVHSPVIVSSLRLFWVILSKKLHVLRILFILVP